VRSQVRIAVLRLTKSCVTRVTTTSTLNPSSNFNLYRSVNAMLTKILQFLPCKTPDAWLDQAVNNLPLLLIDHANCEKKAAATAMNLMYRHVAHSELLIKMSQLAREELLHFQQVVEILSQRNIAYIRLSPSRYARDLRKHIGKTEKQALVDILIIGAYIEARSCERFARLITVLDDELVRFYTSLLKSEARHFQDYLDLADRFSDAEFSSRIRFFAEVEENLILSVDEEFRFHSGPLA